ncbi:MAG TPA: S1 family peptidase [Pseudolabrys sp.]|nr:S1 family peptidase [Pseudolabrys sp.]
MAKDMTMSGDKSRPVLTRRVTGRKFFAFLLVLLSAIGSAPSHAVVGGERMRNTMFLTRYIVAITYNNDEGAFKACTGGIIGPQIVVTAAHCVPKDISSMRVVINDTQFQDDAIAVLPVAAARIHPLYEQSKRDFDNAYDLAVIKTRGPLPGRSLHLQVAGRNFPIEQIPTVYVIGYGVTGFDKKGQPINNGLLYSAVVERLGGEDDDKFIRLDQKKGTGACIGDSGGPMVVENAGGYIIMGVASTVFNEADSSRKSLCSGKSTFISAAYFRHWIRKQAFELMQVYR